MDKKIGGAGAYCSAALDGVLSSIAFRSVCPRCRALRVQRGNRAALQRLIEHNHPIEAYCEVCNGSWPITHRERLGLASDISRLAPPKLSVAKLQSSQGASPASHLDALQRLLAVRELLARPGQSLQRCLEAVLEAALFVTGAPRGNLQLFDGEGLRIAVQRGFERPFLDFFAIVRHEEDSACGTALGHAQRIMVHDVKSSDIFVGTRALTVLLEAQVRAVVSTPLVGSPGQVIGMLSTHFASPHTPSEHELAHLDLLASQAANYLGRRASEEVPSDGRMHPSST